jgi:hypothetical protein
MNQLTATTCSVTIPRALLTESPKADRANVGKMVVERMLLDVELEKDLGNFQCLPGHAAPLAQTIADVVNRNWRSGKNATGKLSHGGNTTGVSILHYVSADLINANIEVVVRSVVSGAK